MAKIMLVEDDNNLREIYEARLQAEGYTLVAAKDGEEALVLAKNELPDLIIADVMMPKVSGFEMLDILRNTDGLKAVKVIMLTALGQSDDQQRADRLGADRYLVKSQVTLEDIVKMAHELLNDGPELAPETAVTATVLEATEPETSAIPDVTPPSADLNAGTDTVPSEAEPTSVSTAMPVSTPVDEPSSTTDDSVVQSSAQEEAGVDAKIEDFVASSTPSDTPSAPTDSTSPEQSIDANDGKIMSDAIDSLMANTRRSETPPITATPETTPTTPVQLAQQAPSDDATIPSAANGSVPIAHKKVISPLETTPPKQDINALVAQDETKIAATEPTSPPVAADVIAPSQPIVMSDTATDAAEPSVDSGVADTDAKSTPFNPTDPNHIAL